MSMWGNRNRDSRYANNDYAEVAPGKECTPMSDDGLWTRPYWDHPYAGLPHGEWECPKCYAENNASEHTCWQCGSEK